MSDSNTITDDRPILVKLLEIQNELNVPKNRWNKFGGFFSRSKEDILEAVKPLAHERGCVVVCDDESKLITAGDGSKECAWVYIRSTARLIDVETGELIEAHSEAREAIFKKGMDASQISGTSASYAGKRALGNLFALDDTADSDDNNQEPTPIEPPANGSFVVKCQNCGRDYTMPSREVFEQLQHDPNACNCGINAVWKVVG